MVVWSNVHHNSFTGHQMSVPVPNPLDADPTWMQSPRYRPFFRCRPPGCKAPWIQTPPACRPPSHVTCDACWEATPRGQKEWHTLVKILPCSKLHLRVVKIPSGGHQMSLAEMWDQDQGRGFPCLMSEGSGSHVYCPGGGRVGGPLPMTHSEVQCIVGNGHMGPTHGHTELQTHMTENITFPQLR